MPDFAAARERMVERQLAARGITDPLVLQAFRDVPRELFVAPEHGRFAYDDNPLPIPAEQTISQPFIVAVMIREAGVRPGANVLEVGAGSGYAAAILGRIAGSVIGVERHAQLARLASERVKRLGLSNVSIVHADGTAGAPEGAPFDAIILSAAGPDVPQPLLAQLAPGGVLVMPLGGQDEVQRLVRFSRRENGSLDREELGAVRFVPLLAGLGEGGAM